MNYQRRDFSGEHGKILATVVARDAGAANSRLLDHYKKTGAVLSGLLEAICSADLAQPNP